MLNPSVLSVHESGQGVEYDILFRHPNIRPRPEKLIGTLPLISSTRCGERVRVLLVLQT